MLSFIYPHFLPNILLIDLVLVSLIINFFKITWLIIIKIFNFHVVEIINYFSFLNIYLVKNLLQLLCLV